MLKTNEALELTTDTMTLATLSGSDFSEATKEMTAALRGFHMEMDQGSRITDVYSELAANAAADVQGIAYAMSKTASIASNAGMEFETTSAFLTQMVETTQEAPENIGTAMKTIIARFTELKENIAGTEDSEFDDLDYNKVDKALKSVGISIKDATGQFRNLDDVFLELSSKWDTLDRNQQRYIATTAAGSRQQSRFIAMMENYDRTMELVGTAYDSAGKSAEQFAKYQDTLEYKMKQLSNSWEKLRTDFLNSSLFKGLLTVAEKIVSYIDNLDLVSLASHIITVVTALKMVSVTLDIIKNKTGKGVLEVLGNVKGISGKVREKHGLDKEGNPAKNVEEAGKKAGKQISSDMVEAGEKSGKQIETNIEQGSKNGATEIEKALERGGDAAAEKIEKAMDKNAGTDTPEVDVDLSEIEENGKIVEKSTDATNDLKDSVDELTDVEKEKKNNNNLPSIDNVSDNLEESVGKVKDNVDELIEDGENLSGAVQQTTQATKESAGKLAKLGKGISTALQAVQIVAAIASVARMIGSAINDALESADQERKEEYANAMKALETRYTTNDTLTAQNDQKKLKDAVEAVTKYQGRTFLSDEQQKTLTESQNFLKENYPNVIKSIDASTGKMSLLTDAIEKETKALKDQEDGARRREVGDIAGAHQLAYNDALEYWGDQSAGSLEDDSIWTEAGLLGGILAGVGGLIGSIVPVLGTSIGVGTGAAIGAAIGGVTGIGIGTAGQAAANANMTKEEFETAFSQLSEEAQQNFFNKFSGDQEREIHTLDELSEWMGKDEKKLDECVKCVQEILKEMKEKAAEEDARDAVRANLLSKQYKNYKGEDIKADELLVNALVSTENSKAIKDFTEVVNNANLEIGDENLSKRKSELDKITKAFGGKIDAYEFADQFRNDMVKLLDSGDLFPEFKDLTPSQQNLLKKYGLYSEEEYGYLYQLNNGESVGGLDFKDGTIDDPEDLDKLMPLIKKQLIGQFTDLSGISKETEQQLIDFYKDKRSEEWIERRNKIMSGANLTPEQAKKEFDKLKKEIEDANYVKIAVKFGGDMNEEGSFKNLQKKWEEAQKNLKDIGINKNIVESLSGESVSALNSFFVDVLSKYENSEEITAAIVGMYNDAFTQLENKGLSNNAKTKVQDYLTEIMSPEDFDVTKMSEYIAKLGVLTGDVNYARETVLNFYRVFEENEIKPKGTEDTEKSLESLSEHLTDTKNKFSSLVSSFSNMRAGKITFDIATNITGSDIFRQMLKLDGTFDAGVLGDAIYNDIAADAYEAEALLNKDGTNVSDVALQTLMTALLAQEAYNGLGDKAKDLRKAQKSAQKSYDSALRTLDKNEKSKKKAEEALEDAKYGPKNYQPQLDALYNYDKQLEFISKDIEKQNDLLKEQVSLQEKISILSKKNVDEHEQSVTRLAKMQVLQNAMEENAKWLAQYSDYVKEYSDGSIVVNADAYTADRPGLAKETLDDIMSRADKQNTWKQTLIDLENEEHKAEQQRLEEKKTWLSDYVKLLETGAQKLKEQDEKELDQLRNKYDAMKSADDDYLNALEDAINKQKELRDKENKYEELATKEKKLALMQRDTSGANQKEIQSLQKDIEKDRQSLLDDSIQNLIDTLKEQQENQQEIREIEVELKEAIINATNYAGKFEEILSTWTGPEDATAWFFENTDSTNMTTEQVEKLMNEFVDAYNSGSIYMASVHEDLIQYTEASSQEVSIKIKELGDFLLTSTELTTADVKKQVDETVADAKESLEEAKIAVNDAQDSLVDLQEELNNAKKNVEAFAGQAEQAQKNMLHNMTENFKNESHIMQQITAKTLLGLFSREEVLNRLGISGDQLDKILSEDYLLTDETTKKDNTKTSTKNKQNKKEEKPVTPLSHTKPITKKQAEEDRKNGYDVTDDTVKTSEKNSTAYLVFRDIGTNDAKENFGIKTEGFIEDPKAALEKKYPNPLDFKQQREMYGASAYTIKIEKNNEKKYLLVYDRTEAAAKEVADIFSGEKGFTRYIKAFDDKDSDYKKFASGGLVNYTGPAWVDGTPSKPEAFLSAQDTENISMAAKLLSQNSILQDLQILMTEEKIAQIGRQFELLEQLPQIYNKDIDEAYNAIINSNNTIGDVSVEINLNIDHINNEYDVEEMIEKVRTEVTNAAKPIGSAVFLRQ